MTGVFLERYDGVYLGLGVGFWGLRLFLLKVVPSGLICIFAQRPYFSRSVPDKVEDSFICT